MKTLFRTALIAAAAAVALPAAASAAPAHHAHAPKAAPAKAKAKAKAAAAKPARAQGIWIDVRTPEEYESGHLDGAINIPHDQIAAKIAAASPDKNAPVNLYCRSGKRAGIAKQELEKLGYTRVTNHGGYQDLLDKGIK